MQVELSFQEQSEIFLQYLKILFGYQLDFKNLKKYSELNFIEIINSHYFHFIFEDFHFKFIRYLFLQADL